MHSRKPIVIGLLGARGVGKTSFLGGLGALSHSSTPSKVHVHGLDPASVDFLDRATAYVVGDDSTSTPMPSTVISFHVQTSHHEFDIKLFDYDGDLLEESVRRMNVEEASPLLDQLSESDLIFVMLDPQVELAGDSTNGSSSARERRYSAILTALAERRRRSGSIRHRQPPDVAVVVTKADLVPGLIGAPSSRDFVERRAGGFIDKITREANKTGYFAISATKPQESAAEYNRLLNFVAQRAISRRQQPVRRALVAVFGLSLLAGVCGLGWFQFERDRQFRYLGSESASKTERLENTAGGPIARSEIREALFRERIEEIAAEVSGNIGERRLEDLQQEVRRLSAASPGTSATRLAELERTIDEKIEIIWIDRIREHAENQRGDFDDLVAAFNKRFPDSKRRGNVDEWHKRFAASRQATARHGVRMIAASDASSLLSKSQAILNYVERYAGEESEEEVQRMRKAAEWAAKFAKPGVYKVRLKRTGNFTSTRIQHIKLFVGDKLAHEAIAPSAATISYWDGKWVDVNWTVGQSVELMLVSKSANWVDTAYYWVARRRLSDPLALRVLSGEGETIAKPSWLNVFVDGRPIIETELAAPSREDWRAIADYLLPGDKW